MTTGEYVAQLEAGAQGVPDVSTPLPAEAEAFLRASDSTLLLLGEPGSGKSMFTWQLARQLLSDFDTLLEGLEQLASCADSPGSGAELESTVDGGVPRGAAGSPSARVTLWVPVVVDMQRLGDSNLSGLLPR
jgi:hypothetical protein